MPYNTCTISSLFSIFLLLYVSIILSLFYTKHFPNPKLTIDSTTTKVSLSFIGNNITVKGDITLFISNPTAGMNVFVNVVSISVFYKNKDNKPTTDQLLSSTNLPEMYVEGIYNEASYTREFYGTSTISKTIDLSSGSFFVGLSAFLSLNGTSSTYFSHPKGHQCNVFCYPLRPQVSTNATSKVTTVLLAELSC